MEFQYHCTDELGEEREGLLEAVTTEAARAELERRGWRLRSLKVLPTVVMGEPMAVRARPAPAALPRFDDVRLSLRNLALYTMQQSTLTAAGIPYARSLRALSEGEPREVALVANRLHVLVLSGRSLSESMATMPGAFDPVYVTLIRIGERTGALPRVMQRLAEDLQRAEERRSWLVSAMAYPLFTMLVSGLMVAFIFYYMLPQFLTIFADLGGELPLMTRIVMAVADPAALGVLMVLVGSVIMWWLVASRTPAGQAQIEFVLYRTPVLGDLTRQALLARMARSLALMLASGLRMSQALRLLVSPTTGYHKMDEAIRELAKDMEHTGDLVGAFERCQMLPGLMVDMLKVGAQTGDMRPFLDSYAEFAEMQLQMTVQNMLALVEPITIGLLGVVVGGIVLSVFLPVYQLLGAF